MLLLLCCGSLLLPRRYSSFLCLKMKKNMMMCMRSVKMPRVLHLLLQ